MEKMHQAHVWGSQTQWKPACGGPCGPQCPSLLSPLLGACFVFNMNEYIHINEYLKDWYKLNCFRKPRGNVISIGIHDLTFLFPLDEVSKICKVHVKDGCINGFLFIHNSKTNCFSLPQGHEIGFNMTLQKYSWNYRDTKCHYLRDKSHRGTGDPENRMFHFILNSSIFFKSFAFYQLY